MNRLLVTSRSLVHTKGSNVDRRASLTSMMQRIIYIDAPLMHSLSQLRNSEYLHHRMLSSTKEREERKNIMTIQGVNDTSIVSTADRASERETINALISSSAMSRISLSRIHYVHATRTGRHHLSCQQSVNLRYNIQYNTYYSKEQNNLSQ